MKHLADLIGYLAAAAVLIIFFLSIRSCTVSDDYTLRTLNCATKCIRASVELGIDPAPCVNACKELFAEPSKTGLAD